MPAGIESTDALFVYRKPSWHGLEGSNLLLEYPSREEAQKLAHNWENVPEPLYRKVPFIRPHEHSLSLCGLNADGLCDLTDDMGEEFEKVEEFVLNTRSDNGAPLGVVSKDWGQTTNDDLYEIAEAIEGEAKSGSVMYESGGSLYGGKKVWLLIRLKQIIEIKGDPHGGHLMFYALQNSYDGSGAFRGQATNVRIECANTSRMADLQAELDGTEYVFRHTSNIRERIEEAKTALAGWRNSIQAFKRQSEFLIEQPVSESAARRFVEEFIPMPPPHLASDRVQHNVTEARATLWGYLEGPTCEGINRTAYGLLQGALEYREWGRRARSQQSRFKRAVLDRDQIVVDAVELAQRAAKESVGVV